MSMTTIISNGRSLGAALALALAAASCDQPPAAEERATESPTTAPGLDEGNQIPNVVARLELGRSTVYFAEPAPGMIIVGEHAQGEPVLKPGLPNEPGAIWKAIAGNRAMPSALREALARSSRPTRGTAPPPAQVTVRRPSVTHGDVADKPLDLGPGVLASTRGGSQDPTDFINYYCSNWLRFGGIAESCATNRTTSNSLVVPFEMSGNVYFARAAVASYRGTFRFVPQWNSFFSWSNLADITTEPGHSWSWWVSRSQPSFGFRYWIVDANGDGYHRMHWIDGQALDLWGLGSYVIPNNG
jgi:hypothetical protein